MMKLGFPNNRTPTMCPYFFLKHLLAKGFLMKKIFGVILGFGLLLSQISFGESVVYTVLRVESSGGRVPQDQEGWRRGVVIFSDGNVESYARKSHNEEDQYKKIASLNKATMKILKADIEKMPLNEEMLFEGTPCKDLPFVEYTAPLKSEKAFAAKVQCRDGMLRGYKEAKRLKAILKSLDEISREISKVY